MPTFTDDVYLELHRGTLTTQGLVKKLNRESEHRLAGAEAFSALASLEGASYPHEVLDRNWQSLLLNQFHDILPGSSINEVYLDTHRELRAVVDTATAHCDTAITTLSREGKGGTAIANPSLHPRPPTAILPEGAATGASKGISQPVEGGTLAHAPDVTVGGFGFVNSVDKGKISKETRVSASSLKGSTVIENALLRFTIGVDDTIHEVRDKTANRHALSDRGNQLWAYVDHPCALDA